MIVVPRTTSATFCRDHFDVFSLLASLPTILAALSIVRSSLTTSRPGGVWSNCMISLCAGKRSTLHTAPAALRHAMPCGPSPSIDIVSVGSEPTRNANGSAWTLTSTSIRREDSNCTVMTTSSYPSGCSTCRVQHGSVTFPGASLRAAAQAVLNGITSLVLSSCLQFFARFRPIALQKR